MSCESLKKLSKIFQIARRAIPCSNSQKHRQTYLSSNSKVNFPNFQKPTSVFPVPKCRNEDQKPVFFCFKPEPCEPQEFDLCFCSLQLSKNQPKKHARNVVMPKQSTLSQLTLVFSEAKRNFQKLKSQFYIRSSEPCEPQGLEPYFLLTCSF